MADSNLENDIYILALQNAVKNKAVPRAGAVLGSVMGAHPELRSQAKEINAMLPAILAKVEALSAEEREAQLRELNPEAIEKMHEKKERIHELPTLPDAEGGVVMRFAPNPSGPLHLGHARASVLNDYYVKKYGGKFYYRVEDTDPKRVDPEAYDMVSEDLKWLGIGITDVVYQSDRFEIYYDLARELIKLGGAYMCDCDNAEFRDLKLKKQACPCRDLSVEENLKRFDDMLAGKYEEGQITMRVKTDIAHPDPAVRDFAAMRVLKEPKHPRKPEIFVYPLMNFSVAVDDHLLGMTHVIRGKDHIANTRRQEYIYNYFGWKMPYFYHYGRMSIAGLELSTSGMRKGINEGLYTGWDDIHLGTLRALARRGIQAEAVRGAVVDIGMGDTDISFSWENLFAANKAIIDADADRYFFVPDAVEVTVSGAPEMTAHAPVYPNKPERGERLLPFTGKVLLPRAEVEKGGMLRLKDLFNIRMTGDSTAEYAGESLAEARKEKAPIIQWLPAEKAAPCSLLTPEGMQEGFAEPEVLNYEGKIVQFERVGFAKIDAVENGKAVAYHTHR
ncbi:MAG TPA: glutamate--tRNA ligase [Methanocorpusculum sp.]|jgi:glutamyl-tRNA synthetase|nr:glutamate--tRNA ligase [Methanocorpusculum sp.]MEE1135597.1 glutamate--tRNA ligase [Methanocorpusculum sp.]HJJ62579.1 glutamate--tRNA ligase [Methanocorpusculum sp.]HJJ67507.1 glutamate--tRNA ligase [Methanocorpusculum sp.]HJJ71045.1 glutamate--tRNA ligase [Methanocorpusculum sp.]